MDAFQYITPASTSMSEMKRDEEPPSFSQVDGHIQENLEDELVQEALQKGVDLRQYSQQIERELKRVEGESIADYIAESQNIANLHNQISACDEILERMGTMLFSFQEDLSSISHEILTIQRQSVAMNIRLKNRQAIRSELSQFVDDVVVPESMITGILDSNVTDQSFVDNVSLLDSKITFAKEQSSKEARVCVDVRDILEKLKIKAVSKIREFLLQRIYQFRKPMANYQLVQNMLLKFKFYYKFLYVHEKEVAKEVQEEYVDTVSKMYYTYFKAYTTRLMKLQFDELADKDDLMGVDEGAKKGLFGSKPVMKSRATIFTLGNRGNVLTVDLEAPIIVPHAVQKSDVKHSFESLFRSQQFALADNTCREFVFISEFFIANSHIAQDIFGLVFGKTLAMLLKYVDTYVQGCFDAIALFLCMHITHRYKLLMHKRAIPALDRYWETLIEMIWPRLQHIITLNIQSVQECNPRRLGTIDVRPHYITRRYAEFSSTLVAINDTFPDERVNRLLAQMQGEVQNFTLRMAAEFPHRKEQLVFLINNYDMMLTIIVERVKDGCKEIECFKELLSARTQEYVEEILAPYFGGLVSFVKEMEMMIEKGYTDQIRVDEKRVVVLARSFAQEWRSSIDSINGDVMRSFVNFRVGTNILQLTLTQMIQYYHRFQKVLAQPPFKNMSIRSELINIHHIMVEVKKYKPTF